MKRYIRIISAVILAIMLSSCGVGRMKDIRINSFQIEQFSPHGFRSIDIIASAEVDNPAADIRIDSLEGKIFRLSEEIGTLDAEPILVPGKSVTDFKINARLTLSRNVGLFEVLEYASRFNVDDYTIDARAEMRLGKRKKAQLIEIKDTPLNNLITLVSDIQQGHIENK